MDLFTVMEKQGRRKNWVYTLVKRVFYPDVIEARELIYSLPAKRGS